MSGYDVDSYGDKIYVNRSSQYLDVYTVILIDDNGIPGLQPNMHPDLPSSDPNYGPMETRQLSLLATYSQSTHGVPLGNGHTAELYADVDRVFMINPDSFGAGLGGYGTIASWTFANTYTQPISVAHPTNAPSGIETLAYDGLWYCANRARSVFSYHVPTNEWVAEFQFPSLSGGHSDGMEAVTDPNTGIKYLYVSDMTSGMLAQYRRAGTSWVMENVFSNENDADYVEGLGFGAFNHFWITSGSTLYEIGGGDLTQFLE